MKYIIGKDRTQFELFCLEERIDENNEVRLIELFVDSLPLADFGFVEDKVNPQGGRPAYHPSVLLKLFLYGYMNRIRCNRGAPLWNHKETMGFLLYRNKKRQRKGFGRRRTHLYSFQFT